MSLIEFNRCLMFWVWYRPLLKGPKHATAHTEGSVIDSCGVYVLALPVFGVGFLVRSVRILLSPSTLTNVLSVGYICYSSVPVHQFFKGNSSNSQSTLYLPPFPAVPKSLKSIYPEDLLFVSSLPQEFIHKDT